VHGVIGFEARGLAPWNDATVQWQLGLDSVAHHARLEKEGERLAHWPPAPFETTATDCFRVGDDYWIWQPGVGGVTFREDDTKLVAFPSSQIGSAWFEYLIKRSWLPAIYQVWRRQVLHASAVVSRSSGDVYAFLGPSQAGKSTFAYGLAERESWNLLSDDTLAFSWNEDPTRPAGIALHRLENNPRLRPASAAYFGHTSVAQGPIEWPAGPLNLRALYFLESDAEGEVLPGIARLRAAESYPRLLKNAHALTLTIAAHNRRLMRDYLALAANVPAFRLVFRKSFDVVQKVFDAVDDHILSLRAA
jgi:hypothetical protein